MPRPHKRTKTDQIRDLLAQGYSSGRIAKRLGVTTQRVCIVRWSDRKPGYYAKRMADKRKNDPEYRAYERYRQRQYDKKKRARTRVAVRKSTTEAREAA